MDHTEECQEYAEHASRAILSYKMAYPRYCRTCGGDGCHTSPGDKVPYGSTWVRLPDEIDPCEDCVMQGKCPRCAAQTIDPDTCVGPCSACGWSEKCGGIPPEPECWCALVDQYDPPGV